MESKGEANNSSAIDIDCKRPSCLYLTRPAAGLKVYHVKLLTTA